MGDHQGVKALPPADVPIFPAQESNHVDHVGDFGRAKRRIEGGHDTAALSNNPTNLADAGFFHRPAKIRDPHRQRSGHWTIPLAGWPMATEATLGVNQIHALVTPATRRQETKQDKKN